MMTSLRTRLASLLHPKTGDPRAFRLTRYFASVAIVAFLVFGLALYALESLELGFIAQVQSEQLERVTRIQRELATMQQESARRDLIAVHEAAHVNLALTMRNALWADRFKPLLEAAATLSAPQCGAKSECKARWQESLRLLARRSGLAESIASSLVGTTVFKVKVFDRAGVTLYSSDESQIGEDKSGNQGWQRAFAGTPASEVTHRDRFSAFEGLVENRDLISTYIPVRDETGRIVAVFEIYSDLTPFLIQLDEAARQVAAVSASHANQLDQVGRDQRAIAGRNAWMVWGVMVCLLGLLYAALYLVVRNAQNLLDRQAAAQREALRREGEWHREKMAAVATLAAEVAHETNNPLMVISMLAENMALERAELAPQFLEIRTQVQRLAQMTQKIANFASLGGGEATLFDLGYALKALIEFASFDRRFGARRIDLELPEDLPSVDCVPDHAIEALLRVIEFGLRESAAPGAGVSLRVLAVIEPQIVRVHVIPSASHPVGQDAAGLAALTRRVEVLGFHFEASAIGLELHFRRGAGADAPAGWQYGRPR